MAYDLEEQEQIEELKAFWARWGNMLIGIALVGAVVALSWKGYGYYQVKQSEKASQAYDNYVIALQKRDVSADNMLADLQKNYVKSRYTVLATLDAVSAAVSDKNWEKAQGMLQWLVSNASSVENQAVARLQLADVLVQIGKNDEALKTLENLPSPAFTAAFANKRSDIYLMMNDNTKARESIEVALKWLQSQSSKDENLERAIKDKQDLLPN